MLHRLNERGTQAGIDAGETAQGEPFRENKIPLAMLMVDRERDGGLASEGRRASTDVQEL